MSAQLCWNCLGNKGSGSIVDGWTACATCDGTGVVPESKPAVAPVAPPRREVEIFSVGEGRANAYVTVLSTLDLGEALARAEAADVEVDYQRIVVWAPTEVGHWTRERRDVGVGPRGGKYSVLCPWSGWRWAGPAEREPSLALASDDRLTRLTAAAEVLMDLAKMPPVVFRQPRSWIHEACDLEPAIRAALDEDRMFSDLASYDGGRVARVRVRVFATPGQRKRARRGELTTDDGEVARYWVELADGAYRVHQVMLP